MENIKPRPDQLKGKDARKLHLDNLFSKLDTPLVDLPGTTPRKVIRRLQEAGSLASIEIIEEKIQR